MQSVTSGMRPALVAALLCVLPATAGAEGWGINLSYDWGTGSITRDADQASHNVESTILGAGLTYDPNVAKDRLLNYRVDVNFEYQSQRYDDTTPVRGIGMAVNQALGFALVRNRRYRLWIGPSLRLSVAELTEKAAVDRKLWDFQLGFGPVIGFNYNLGERFAASITTGYQYGLHLTESDIPMTDFLGDRHRVFAGLTFLYRSPDDAFEAAAFPRDIN